MGAIQTPVPQGLDHYFLSYTLLIFQKNISDSSKPFVFVDDTSIIITNSDPSEFKKNINNVFIKINN